MSQMNDLILSSKYQIAKSQARPPIRLRFDPNSGVKQQVDKLKEKAHQLAVL